MIRRIDAPQPRFEPKPGNTVVDVGSNIGVYSAWAADRIGPTGSLLAIEPNPGACAMLERNLEPHPIARIESFACSDEAGEMVLRFPPGRMSVGSLEHRADRTESVEVIVRPLDDIAAEVGIGEVDVEGVELEVLASATALLGRSRRLLMEVDAAQLDDVVDAVESSGLCLTDSWSGMWDLPGATIAHFERRS